MRKQMIGMVMLTDMTKHIKFLEEFKNTFPACTSPDRIANLCLTERMLVQQMILKVADLSHLTSSWDVHVHWVAQLEEEYFRQGDKEQSTGIPVSALMDRSGKGVTASQVGFFQVVAVPLFDSFTQLFPACRPLASALQINYLRWSEAATTE